MLKPCVEVEVVGPERDEVVAVERSGDSDDEAGENPRDRPLDRDPHAHRLARPARSRARRGAAGHARLLERERDGDEDQRPDEHRDEGRRLRNADLRARPARDRGRLDVEDVDDDEQRERRRSPPGRRPAGRSAAAVIRAKSVGDPRTARVPSSGLASPGRSRSLSQCGMDRYVNFLMLGRDGEQRRACRRPIAMNAMWPKERTPELPLKICRPSTIISIRNILTAVSL